MDVDVGIDNIVDITAQTSPEHYPGMPITINCTVREYLNDAIGQSFDVIFTIDDNVDDLPGITHYANQTVLPPDLPPGGVLDLTWHWTPPLHAPQGSSWNYSEGHHIFTAIFSTAYDGDINSSNNQMKLNITVLNPNFDLELESGWGGVPEPIKLITIQTNDVTKFSSNFTVYNLGKETWVDFKVIVPKDWMATIPTPIFMPSFSNTSGSNLSFTVFPSSDREYSPTQEELPIILEAYSRRYTFAADSVTFKVKIAFIPYPLIYPPETIFAAPFEFFVDVNVTNDGNGQDSFIAEASVGELPFEIEKLTQQGWSAEVSSGKYSRILDRGDNHTVTVKITIPLTVPAGAPCLVNLTVTSEKAMFACPNHPYAVQSGFFYVYSDAYYNVDLQDNISSISMLPDSEETISVRIRNTGNTLDYAIMVNVTSAPEGWIVSIDTDDIPKPALASQDFANIELTIRTPKQVVMGRYYITITASSHGMVKDEAVITVDIMKYLKINLTTNFYLMNIIPEEDNIISINI